MPSVPRDGPRGDRPARGPRDRRLTREGDGDLALLREDLWARWLATDPVRVIAARPDVAAGIGPVWLDGGHEQVEYRFADAVDWLARRPG